LAGALTPKESQKSASASLLVASASGRPFLFDVFRFLVVDLGYIVARGAGCPDEFIQFRLQGLRVAMLRSLMKSVIAQVTGVATPCQSNVARSKIIQLTEKSQGSKRPMAGCEDAP
jgi:hypothetical protein